MRCRPEMSCLRQPVREDRPKPRRVRAGHGPAAKPHPTAVDRTAVRTLGPFAGPKQESMRCSVQGGQTSRRIRVGAGGRADSFTVGHASSILVTRSTAAFLVKVALGSLAASSARTFFDFRARYGFLTYRCRSRSRPGPRWQPRRSQARLEIVISYQPPSLRWNVVTYTAPGLVVDDYPGRVTPESWVNS
ncbi:MAG: hypothetical protein K0R13_1880, partial [Propionibacteriaceae bacterium]|nr:hypothetical protein [Propionibacteriaceae bacterium]